MSESLLAVVDPVNNAIVRLLKGLSPQYQDFDLDAASDAENTAYMHLLRSGLARSLEVFEITHSKKPGRLTATIEKTGTYNAEHFYAIVLPHCRKFWGGWLSRTVLPTDIYTNALSRKVRLTAEGEVAADDANKGLFFAVEFAKSGRGPKPDIEIRKIIAERSAAESADANAMAAAQANASVGDIHIHVPQQAPPVVSVNQSPYGSAESPDSTGQPDRQPDKKKNHKEIPQDVRDADKFIKAARKAAADNDEPEPKDTDLARQFLAERDDPRQPDSLLKAMKRAGLR